MKTICTFAVIFLFNALAATGTVLWNETTDGTLLMAPSAPTNWDVVIHPIGIASDSTNYVIGSCWTAPANEPDCGCFEGDPAGFWFSVPSGKRLTGLVLRYTTDFPGYAFGGFYSSATGAYDGSGNLGSWNAYYATNDLLALLGLSNGLSGEFSINIYPTVDDFSWPTNGTLDYSLEILTQPVPPSLQIASLGNQIIVNWSTNNADGFTLQSASSIVPPVTWSPVTNVPVLLNGQMVITNAMQPEGQFFRLIGPSP